MMPNWGLDHPKRLKQPEKISSTNYTPHFYSSIYNFINLVISPIGKVDVITQFPPIRPY